MCFKAVSDGMSGFKGIEDAGCHYIPVVTGDGYQSMNNEQFSWVNTLLGNVKRALNGTYHTFHPKHLPRYLAEFSYLFNRRFDVESMIERLGCIAVKTAPMQERLLKLAESQWSLDSFLLRRKETYEQKITHTDNRTNATFHTGTGL